jgi:putative glutathione S-transferase
LDIDGVRETINIKHIKDHYYLSHPELNPLGIIPVGPLDPFCISAAN